MTNFGKNIKKVLVFIGILLIVYNIVLFVIAGFSDHTSTFWCSYAFMIFAFISFASIYIINFRKGFTLKDWVFGFPILKWSVFYVISQLILSIIFMLIPGSLIKVAFIVQFLILCVYLGIVASCFVAKRFAISEKKNDEKVNYIRSIGVSLETIRNEVSDPALKIEFEKLMDTARYSDPMSHESLNMIEQEIEQNISLLRGYVFDGNFKEAMDSIKYIDNLIKERNAACKISKKLK